MSSMEKSSRKKLDLRTAVITAIACTALSTGAGYLQNIMNLMQSAKIGAPKAISAQAENPREVYAILANGSGPSESKRYSEENANYSMLNILASYKHLKEEGVSDKNITLLLYNPSNTDIFATKEYKSLLEKKLFSSILPSKEDKLEIDGEATRGNFINALNNLHSDLNDVVYIFISSPSPKEEEREGNLKREIIYSKANNRIELDKEPIFPGDINLNPNYGKIIMILNQGDAGSFLLNLNKNVFAQSYFLSSSEKKEMNPANLLVIGSPNKCGFDKETFIMQLLSKTLISKEHSIKDIFNNLKDCQAYYLDGTKKSIYECPWANEPLFPVNK
jgi:hypothetical protein